MTEPVKPPGEAEIDALARRLPRRVPSPERSLAMRRAVLEAASHARPGSGGMRRAAWLGATAATAAAAVWAVIALRATHPAHRDATASATAAAHGTAPAPGTPATDGSVAVASAGRLAEGVTAIKAAHPVQLAQGDATLTAPPGADLEVEVRQARIVRVAVRAGWVVLASARSGTTMIPAPQTWIAPVVAPDAPSPSGASPPAGALSPSGAPTVQRAASASDAAASGPARGPASLPSLSTAAEPRLPAFERMPSGAAPSPPAAAPASPDRAHTADAPRVAEADPKASAPPSPPPPPPSAESEQAFQRGLRALLAGDVQIAAQALDRACAAPSTIQQDACYWAAVAWRRAGDRARARTGFADILARWPHSPHAGEASVGLGWVLLEAGERAEARMRFAAGAADPTPSVRAEALRGLSAAR